MTDPAATTDTDADTDAAEDLGPVRTEVTVAAAPEKAFRVFTEGFSAWWPQTHHIAEGELEKVVIEPFVGGRWYERTTGGTECDWGEVIAWEPPDRLALSWSIDGEWAPDPDHASRIDVTFTPAASGGTTVAVEHSEFAGHKAAGALHGAVGAEGGWPTILVGYVEASTGA